MESISIKQETTSSGKPRFIVTVPVLWSPEPKLFDRVLKKKQEPESTREFVFDPMVVGKCRNIANKISMLPSELFGNTPAELAGPVLKECYPDLVYIVGSATIKGIKEPDEELLMFLEMNLTFEALLQCAHIALTQLQLDKFLQCIILLRGSTSILKPKAEPETESVGVAPGRYVAGQDIPKQTVGHPAQARLTPVTNVNEEPLYTNEDIENLKAQKELLIQMRNIEVQKSNLEPDKIADYDAQIADIPQQIEKITQAIYEDRIKRFSDAAD